MEAHQLWKDTNVKKKARYRDAQAGWSRGLETNRKMLVLLQTRWPGQGMCLPRWSHQGGPQGRDPAVRQAVQFPVTCPFPKTWKKKAAEILISVELGHGLPVWPHFQQLQAFNRDSHMSWQEALPPSTKLERTHNYPSPERFSVLRGAWCLHTVSIVLCNSPSW